MANTTNLNLPKPVATNTLDVDVVTLQNALDQIDAAVAARAIKATTDAHAASTSNPHSTTAAQVGAVANTPGSVTDALIGARTIDPAGTASSNSGQLTALLSAIAGRVRAIMGTTNWYDPPATTLANAFTHIGNTANPHATTAVQVGAIPDAGGSVNDVRLGSRIADPTLTPSGGAGTLTQWVSWFANRIRAITGATHWYDAPATTLANAGTHIGNTSNPHATTAAQVGAPTTVGVGASGTWGINVTGNAGTATKLATPRTINGVAFDGSANIEVPVLKSTQIVQLDANASVAWTSGGDFSGGSYRDYTISSVTLAKCLINIVSNIAGAQGIFVSTQNGTERNSKLRLINDTTLRLSINATAGSSQTVIVGAAQIVEFG